jgi:hypothetical protein
MRANFGGLSLPGNRGKSLLQSDTRRRSGECNWLSPVLSFLAPGGTVTRRRFLLAALAIAAAVFAGFLWWNRRQPVGPVEIYEGVTYRCERLEAAGGGAGLVHWVRVDLAAPGIEIYVTPLDSQAVAQGWQYRLRRTGKAVQEEKLAVGINGTLFTSDSGWIRMAGDLARAVETTVAEHHVSHVWEHTYLLWFEDDLSPHLETTKPPGEQILDQARWGIGCQGIGLTGDKVRDGIERIPADSRTAVGIDRERKLLWLAVFEKVSPRHAMEKLAELGAKDGILLDGGDSTSMALGEQARGVRPGVLTGDWRPVATHLGVRARALAPN